MHNYIYAKQFSTEIPVATIHTVFNNGNRFLVVSSPSHDQSFNELSSLIEFLPKNSILKVGNKLIDKKDLQHYVDRGNDIQVYAKQFSNPVSSKLPDDVDNMLHDMAQFTGQFTYNDIIKFEEKASRKDIAQLKKIAKAYDNWERSPEDFEEMAIKEIVPIIKQLSAKVGSLIFDPNDPSRILIVTKVANGKISARPYLQYIDTNDIVELDAATDIKNFSKSKGLTYWGWIEVAHEGSETKYYFNKVKSDERIEIPGDKLDALVYAIIMMNFVVKNRPGDKVFKNSAEAIKFFDSTGGDLVIYEK